MLAYNPEARRSNTTARLDIQYLKRKNKYYLASNLTRRNNISKSLDARSRSIIHTKPDMKDTIQYLKNRAKLSTG
jgi:hypothetical protein